MDGRRVTLIRRYMCRTVAALALILAVSGPAAANSQPDRTLTLYNIHTKETTTVTYKRGGRYDADAMKKLDWALRDWRRDEATRMDPALIDLIWEIHAELGSKEPVHIISGYRSRGTNAMLRNTVGGQASESRHILGKAADVHFPDVPVRMLRYSALIRERGGVGYYPTSAIPFVHIDTDRVRHWPRMPRQELALLFPSGRSQHTPADGSPIGPDDVRNARMRYSELAVQIASFHDLRRTSREPRPTLVAALVPPAPVPAKRPAQAGITQVAHVPDPTPRLVEQPRLVDRPSRLSAPSDRDRQRLTELARLALADPAPVGRPEPQSGIIFVQAPAFDEEHPEELSYRPFPVAPLMTATASIDDPAFAALQHPDVARTLEMLDQSGSAPPMRLRPSEQLAAMIWSRQFRGEAINLSALTEARAATGVTSRKVATSSR